MWGSPEVALSELRVIAVLATAVTGREVVPLEDGIGALAKADIIFAGLNGPRGETAHLLSVHRSHAVCIWFAYENLDGYPGIGYGDFADQLIDAVDISLGQARYVLSPDVAADARTPPGAVAASLAVAAPNFVRTPWWLPYALEPGRCALHPSLYARGDAAAWAARPGFAAQLAKHAPYPRTDLFANFSALAAELNAAGAAGRADRRVDAPGIAFHNMEWPGGPNSHLAGKIEFVANYRFNIQPENSRSAGRGYNTEKMPQAHMAGAVPVWWGDPIDDEVFNPARVLVLRDAGGGDLDMAALVARARELETDAAAREAFFAQPILAPTANDYMERWCSRTSALLKKALEGKVAPAR